MPLSQKELLVFKYSEKILELINEHESIPNGDIQSVSEAIISMAIDEALKLK